MYIRYFAFQSYNCSCYSLILLLLLVLLLLLLLVLLLLLLWLYLQSPLVVSTVTIGIDALLSLFLVLLFVSSLFFNSNTALNRVLGYPAKPTNHLPVLTSSFKPSSDIAVVAFTKYSKQTLVLEAQLSNLLYEAMHRGVHKCFRTRSPPLQESMYPSSIPCAGTLGSMYMPFGYMDPYSRSQKVGTWL